MVVSIIFAAIVIYSDLRNGMPPRELEILAGMSFSVAGIYMLYRRRKLRGEELATAMEPLRWGYIWGAIDLVIGIALLARGLRWLPL